MAKYTKEELERLILIEKLSYVKIGKLFNVSDNAIKKAARRFNINIEPRRKINPKESFSYHKRHYFSPKSNVNKILDAEFVNIIKNSKSWREIALKLGYKKRLSAKAKEAVKLRCKHLNIIINIEEQNKQELANRTKGELFSNRKNWQSARTAIQRMARAVYKEHTQSPQCLICGYDKHVEVAHIKAVAEFDDNATIGEINSINNLIGLCPNHHWEFDNKLLKLN